MNDLQLKLAEIFPTSKLRVEKAKETEENSERRIQFEILIEFIFGRIYLEYIDVPTYCDVDE